MLLASEEARMLLEHSACERPSDEVVRLLRLARRPDVQEQLTKKLGGSGSWQSVIESFTDRDRLIKIREFAEQVILFSKAGEGVCATEALTELVKHLRDKELDDGTGCIDPDLAGL
jgi:hypothetical protein